MENKHNFMGIIIPVVVAVILLTVLPILTDISKECPPCEELPTLYTPTISISGDTLTITQNANNGAFVTGYNIYVDNVLLDTTTSTTYDLSDELTEIDTYEIYVTAYATKFTTSSSSNVVEYIIEPEPTSKEFEVGDILPATTQLKITWEINSDGNGNGSFKTTEDYLNIYFFLSTGVLGQSSYIKVDGQIITNLNLEPEPYEIIIDTSLWNLEQRTIITVSSSSTVLFYWGDLNA